MRKITLALAILGLIGLDQWSKYWIFAHYQVGETHPFIRGFVNLTYLQNRGAAFSILQDQQWLFVVITLLVVGGAIYYLLTHLKSNLWLLTALVLLISGGIGNFIDRIRLGYVVDMIDLDFMDFAIFNLADTYLSIGVIMLMIALWREDSNGSHR
ncbi:signal peptidase II [Streptococcus sp. zg-JUN1979]|uniref:signal peptidase II n=1 Tax=Streptococcus sp. zg-JUN1979 TaxID=3391450 RepID=UPI0039A749E7